MNTFLLKDGHLSGPALEALAEGVGGSEDKEARLHLESCSRCREELKALKMENELFRGELAASEPVASPSRPSGRTSVWPILTGLIAAAVLLISTTAWFTKLLVRPDRSREATIEKTELNESEPYNVTPASETGVSPPKPPPEKKETPNQKGGHATKKSDTPPKPVPADTGQNGIAFFLKRAEDLLKIKNFNSALVAASTVLAIDPNNSKAKDLFNVARKFRDAMENPVPLDSISAPDIILPPSKGPYQYEGRTAIEWLKVLELELPKLNNQQLSALPELQAARHALRQLGIYALDELMRKLPEMKPALRKEMKEILSSLKPSVADLPVLFALARDGHFEVRRTAVRLMAQHVQRENVINVLKTMMEDRDRAVAEAASKVLESAPFSAKREEEAAKRQVDVDTLQQAVKEADLWQAVKEADLRQAAKRKADALRQAFATQQSKRKKADILLKATKEEFEIVKGRFIANEKLHQDKLLTDPEYENSKLEYIRLKHRLDSAQLDYDLESRRLNKLQHQLHPPSTGVGEQNIDD